MNDELREQLRRLDPMPAEVPVDATTSPSSRNRLEAIMSTPVDVANAPEARTPRRPWVLAGAAAAVLALVLAGVAVFGGGDGDGGGETAGPPLELSLPDAGASLSSCLAFDTAVLATMSPAFAATATSVEGDTVTLTVDRWYAGGDAETVVLQAPQGLEALIDGFAFEVGEQYLITAAEGTVNYCGYSGPATPEFTAAFDEAFGG